MTVEYELNEADFKEIYGAVVRPWTYLGWYVFTFWLPAAALLILLGASHESIILVVIAAVIAFIGMARRGRSRALQAMKSNPLLQNKIKMTLDEQSMRMWSYIGESTTYWVAYSRYIETANLFILLLSPGLFRIVPKRAFTPAEIDQLRTLLDEKIVTRKTAAIVKQTG